MLAFYRVEAEHRPPRVDVESSDSCDVKEKGQVEEAISQAAELPIGDEKVVLEKVEQVVEEFKVESENPKAEAEVGQIYEEPLKHI